MTDDRTGGGAVLVERQGHLLIIRLNRPEARNAVNRDVHLGVGLALEMADHDPLVRAVIVTGAGDAAFCAGLDLKARARGESIRPDDPVQAAWGFAGLTEHPIGKPVIAAVNGTALGGGTEIALACDLVISADHAHFGLPEVKRGLVAGAGGAIRLARQVGRKVAMDMLLTGEPITADRALQIGLINAVVPRERLLATAIDLAERIAANAPLSVQASKRIALGIVDGAYTDEVEAWPQARAEIKTLLESEDAREGPRAFAEKRLPIWQAR